ncbi:MAG TPA: cytochrome C [Geobacteraceae bacterium]|nr:cytochrome C [Geobacteraceae bacterium]
MKNRIFIACLIAITLSAGCAMFTSWKAIPPPGGCDQCHTLPISNNWQVAYKAPVLSDEKDRKYFQTEKYNLPAVDKPSSALEVRKVADEKCFECHRSPTPAHKGRMGRFHH